MLQRSTERLDIDLLVLPDANLILIASVIEPLRGANRISGSELYRWRLLTPDGAPVLTTSDIAVPAQGAFKATTEDTPLFVLASYNWRRSATPALKMQLSQAARYRTVIAGIESGRGIRWRSRSAGCSVTSSLPSMPMSLFPQPQPGCACTIPA